MFFRRFLQTSVSFQKPLKSKLNRYETSLNEIGALYMEIKAERLRNLNLIDASSEFASLKFGKIPSVKVISLKIENCSNWEELKNLIPILREIRFLGSPKRTEISRLLFAKLEQIYKKNSDEELLVKCLHEMVSFEQLNPLILPKDTPEESSEIYKTIIYTAKDLAASNHQ